MTCPGRTETLPVLHADRMVEDEATEEEEVGGAAG